LLYARQRRGEAAAFWASALPGWKRTKKVPVRPMRHWRVVCVCVRARLADLIHQQVCQCREALGKEGIKGHCAALYYPDPTLPCTRCIAEEGQPKNDHVTSLLRDRHWLPVKQRVEYKLCTIVHRCLYGDAPSYLVDLLTPSAAATPGPV